MIADSSLSPFTIAAPHHPNRSALAKAVLTSCKASILPHLAAAHIATLRIFYDGGGDEGQISEISAFDAENEPMAIPDVGCERHQLQYNCTILVDVVALAQALENLAETALEALYAGWEDGEGACGEVIINVATRTVTLDHNSRFVSYNTTHQEL